MNMLTTYPLFQYANLVYDIEATIQKWTDVFGVGPGDNPIMAR